MSCFILFLDFFIFIFDTHKLTPMRPLVVLFLLPLFATAQPCIYQAYDAFDYPAGQPLNGQNGGTGWLEPWLVQNNDDVLPGFQIDNAATPAFGDLLTAGNYAAGGRVYLTAGRRLNTADGGPFDAWVAPNNNAIGSQTGGSLWMSALLRKEQNNNHPVFVSLHDATAPWCDNCTAAKVAIGYFEGHSDVGGQRRWTLRVGNDYFPSNVPLTAGATAFLAVEITFNTANTTVAFYVNPSTLGPTIPQPTLTASSAEPLTFRSVAVYLGNSPANGTVDELRLASSYSCVAPDSNVEVNLPPTAVITASITDGQAPLSVNLSGANSYDPEGSSLTYTWNVGDGSPPAAGQTVEHSYSALGNLTIRLTVRDEAGLEHTALQSILVRNQNNSFPCLSSFSLLQQADCAGSGGVIRINDHPNTFSLANAAGSTLTPVNGNEFHQLDAGPYTYTASGANGCSDQFTLYVPVDSATCPGWQPDICDMAIGANMSGFADWVPERPMRNLMKHVRHRFIAFHDECFCWDNGNTDLIATDANGYPAEIPQMAGGAPNKVRFVISSEGANLLPGQSYVLLYDGEGNLTVNGGVTTTGSTPGRIQFEVTQVGNIFFSINSSQAANHVRNIRLLRLADENADIESQPFYEGFLEKIAPFNTLRFMDWGATNHNPVAHWENRSSVDYFTYALPTGVPYEVMIQLANQMHKNVWICVPHAADSNYVAQMAALFRDQLDPELTIYLEYSNEVWNWIFDQAHYNVETAPSNLNYGRAMAAKAGSTFRIWHNVFGDQKSRVKRVLGLQASFNYLNEQILAQLDPDEWDYGSPTSYLGLDHSGNGNPVLNSASTPQDIVANARNAWFGFMPLLRQDYNNVQLFGKSIINYEGGQHFVGNVFGGTYPYQQAMYDAQYSPEIYALYDEMLDTIRLWGSRLFGNFSLASRQESIYGSWGVLNDIDIQPPYLTTAPKYQALLDNLCPDVSTSNENTLTTSAFPLTVYPNPTTGLCWIAVDYDWLQQANLVVMDALGRPVVWAEIPPRAKGSSIPIDLSKSGQGIYIMVLFSENGLHSTKIIKR